MKKTTKEKRSVKAVVELAVKNAGKSGLTKDSIKKIVDKTIFFANFRGFADISVVFLDPRPMALLTKGYKPGKRHTANVLTFVLAKKPLVAEIFICTGQAKKEARAYGLSGGQYVNFLLIHGILHSMGFTHEHDAVSRKRMESLENKILQYIGHSN